MYTLWLLGLVSVTSDRLCMFLFDCCTAGRVNLYLDQIGGVTKVVSEHGYTMLEWDLFQTFFESK